MPTEKEAVLLILLLSEPSRTPSDNGLGAARRYNLNKNCHRKNRSFPLVLLC